MKRRSIIAVIATAFAIVPSNVALLLGPTSPAWASSSKVYNGSKVSTSYGTVQVRITVSGRRIVAVSYTLPTDRPRSAAINDQAGPILKSRTLAAQSAHVHSVSGATSTSSAWDKSLQAAVSAAHI